LAQGITKQSKSQRLSERICLLYEQEAGG
jgi:hypothetical protein